MAKRRRFTSEFKTELVLEVLSGATSQAELCRRHHLNEDQLSKWKQQFLEKAPSLFDTNDKPSLVGVTLSQQRCFISTLQKEHSVREICGTLGFNRSSFYYHSKEDPAEENLRAEIEKLAGAYPRYGYRRITQLLRRQGYTVGTRRVARLMKENHLLVSIKRAAQTTRSLQRDKPWSNRLENLQVSRQDQVWVADITYIRLKGRFIYLCLLMDVFTRLIKAWHISQHLNHSLTLKPLKEALDHSVPEIHHSDQGVQYL